jgi:methyl-accepting chemotaxis protein
VRYLELDVPLMQGALGRVHLGLRHSFISGVVDRATRQAVLVLLVVMGLGLGALALAMNSLLRPIVTLSEVTRRIVEDGDLTQDVVVGSEDELGVLAGHFKAMVERLREIPRTLSAQAEALSAAVAALEGATAAQNAVVTRQATALQETQVTAEEIRQTSQVASRSAEGILGDIAKAESAGEKGTQALEQSLQGLAEILDSVKATGASINELGERTRQIGGITGTVKDLADQSNMLALNAAIEAVRSGEHGKGFALVAREIRRLADQSIQSTERVREILESVRGAVSGAVAGSEEGGRKVESSLGQMRASAEHLRALADVVRDSSAAVRQIATAVNQQNTGVNQVFAAVVDQNKMMEESVKQLDGTLKAVESLKDVSNGLAAVLARYKV